MSGQTERVSSRWNHKANGKVRTECDCPAGHVDWSTAELNIWSMVGIWGAQSHLMGQWQGTLSHLSYGEGWVFSVSCVPGYIYQLISSFLGSQGEVSSHDENPFTQKLNMLTTSQVSLIQTDGRPSCSYKEFARSSIWWNRGPVREEEQGKQYIHFPISRD